MTLRPWCLATALVLVGCPSPAPKPPPVVEPEPTVEPPPPPPPDPQAIVDVATFQGHHCVLRRAGTAACWGKNTYGQTGSGTREDVATPVDVPGVDDAKAIATGRDFSCVLRRGGTVACWGNHEDGQLGDGGGVKPGALSLTPVEVKGLAGVKQLSLGEYHACALDGGGRVWCWGNGADGQLGRTVKRADGTAAPVEDLDRATQIASGRSHVCALLEDGTVRCWGRNTEGQLGGGVSGSRSSNVLVKGLDGVRAIASGHLHTCAVRESGALACWGDNSAQQLGVETPEPRSKVPVASTAATDVDLLAGGGLHTCARVRAGKVVCWGDNAKGQLGVAAGPARAAAMEVQPARRAIDLALGDAHGCALARDGALACWGAIEAPPMR